jgi:uncharacterized integral membrane protein
MRLKSILIVVLIVLITVLSTQNTQSVSVRILFWETSYPLILIVYILLGIGFVTGYAARGIVKMAKKNKKPGDLG